MSPKTASALVALNGYAFLAFALVWATAAFMNGAGPGAFLIDLLDWPIDESGLPLSKHAQWLSAIGAGLTAFVGVISLTVVAPAVARNDRSVMNGTVSSIVAWFLIDSAGSIASGVAANAVFNLLFLVLYLAPLLLVRGRATAAVTG